jgi:hypothetical protein
MTPWDQYKLGTLSGIEYLACEEVEKCWPSAIFKGQFVYLRHWRKRKRDINKVVRLVRSKLRDPCLLSKIT